MKIIPLLALVAALLFVVTPALVADDEEPPKNEGGGSKFGDAPKETEEKPDEPKPLKITFKDYRLEMELKDGRWWKVQTDIPAEEVEKGVMLRGTFKLPKSENAFDAQIFCQGWKHGMKLSFPDGTSMGTDNYKGIAKYFYESDLKEWKEIRDPKKPKAAKVSRLIKKAYRYSFTGLLPAAGNFPLHKEAIFFKHKDKTYFFAITYTTGGFKNKRVTTEINEMLSSLKERKERRRR